MRSQIARIRNGRCEVLGCQRAGCQSVRAHNSAHHMNHSWQAKRFRKTGSRHFMSCRGKSAPGPFAWLGVSAVLQRCEQAKARSTGKTTQEVSGWAGLPARQWRPPGSGNEVALQQHEAGGHRRRNRAEGSLGRGQQGSPSRLHQDLPKAPWSRSSVSKSIPLS